MTGHNQQRILVTQHNIWWRVAPKQFLPRNFMLDDSKNIKGVLDLSIMTE